MWLRRNQTGPRLLWIRLVMLVCFVLGQTRLLPAGVGAALWLEGGHHVELQSTSGQFRLVLHHSPSGHVSRAVAPGEHQHGRISRLLVIGPTAFGAPHPDHLLSFVPDNCGISACGARSGVQGRRQSHGAGMVWVGHVGGAPPWGDAFMPGGGTSLPSGKTSGVLEHHRAPGLSC